MCQTRRQGYVQQVEMRSGGDGIESFLLRKFCPISGPPDIAAFFWAHHSHSPCRQLYDSDSPSLSRIYLVLSRVNCFSHLSFSIF
jgi:hypothetical protein